MKWHVYLLMAAAALCCGQPAFSQTQQLTQSPQLTLAPEQKVTLSYPDVTAVFAKDSSIVRASLENDFVIIRGVAAGETQVVVFIGYYRLEVIRVRCAVVISRKGSPEPASQPPSETESAASAKPSENVPIDKSKLTPGTALGELPGSASMEGDRGANGPATGAPSSSVRMPADKPLSLREANQVLVPVSQVSAAYSLDTFVAEAQITEGLLHVQARAPGQALIVLVHNDFSTSTMQVTVIQAPPILPDRVWSGLDSGGIDSRGFYEVRVSSNPLQVSDILDLRTSRFQLHVTNANAPERNLPGVSQVWFPYSYLRILGENWRLTLVDEIVDSSPISVSSTLLRGAHFASGDLTVHAGYASVAGFQSLFLPAQKQWISGATFKHPFSSKFQVGATYYFLKRSIFALDPQSAQSVGTIFLKAHSLHGFDFSAEAGFSKGMGGAASLSRESKTDQFHANARYRPRHYASSDTDNLNGSQSDARWDRVWSPHFVSALSGSDNRIFTRTGSQAIEVATENLQYRAFKGVSLSSGMSVSRFADNQALFSDIRRYAVPVSVSYDRGRFGAGAQYEFSRTSKAFSAGQGYRGSIRWSGQHFQMNANAGLDTQALGIDSVFTAFPQLNVALAQLGLGAATSVDQLAALLGNRAFLNSLGLAPNATLQLVPRNWFGGLNLSWRWRHDVLEVNSNYNSNSFLTQQNATVIHTARYRKGLSNSTEVLASFTLLESITPVHRRDSLWEIGLRHQIEESPFPRWHQHSGTISGTARLKDRSGDRPLSTVEILLDGDRKTITDSDGHYRFSKVPDGVHCVEIKFKSLRTFWYTTPSKVDTAADSIVDFGVVYPSAEIIGYVLNDAGAALPATGILVKGLQGEINLISDQAGKFVVPVVEPGVYVIRIDPETVPDGYSLEDIEPASISVAEGEYRKVSIVLLGIRALSGSVRSYDPTKGSYIPLTGVTVQLDELKRKTITDANGRYLFRDLPSGVFTIFANGQPSGQVQISTAPQQLKHDIVLSPGALAMTRRDAIQ
jgi:hypothetical protein